MIPSRHIGLTILMTACAVSIAVAATEPPVDVNAHLAAIAKLAVPSPVIAIPEGGFLMGTNRKGGMEDPYSLDLQFDNTEQPQRRIWLDRYTIDRDEVSLSEYVAWLRNAGRPVSAELRKLIHHMRTVHFMPDEVLATWPALYVTWEEARDYCRAKGKRLPTEAEWEKAARGTEGNLFPWGHAAPVSGLAVFGQYHVHEIPLVAAVTSGQEGQSPYGVRHMAGNIAEWVNDWFGPDYYPIMPDRNPRGPTTGRYRVIRGGSWKSHPQLLRTATRNGAPPEQRSSTVGFRCARA